MTTQQIEQLYNELIPPELDKFLDLKDQFSTLKPYFYEWIKWVAIDIIFDYIPNPDEITLDKKIHDSPWSFVVSLGFLKSALKLLRDSSVTERFPLVLYYSIAQLYIMRNEKGISLHSLISVLNKYFLKELVDLYGDHWGDKVSLILNTWASPSKRLIPPFKYPKNDNSMSNDVIITCYHLQWAEEVCNFLDSNGNKNFFERTNITVFPTLFKIWSEIKALHKGKEISFSKWLRENIRVHLNEQGEIQITSFNVEEKERKSLTRLKLDENFFKDLDQSELQNWLFIKGILSN